MGAVPNLISWIFCPKLAFISTETDLQVRAAEVTAAQLLGRVRRVPVHLEFMVVNSAPFNVIVGIKTLESLQTRTYYELQHVTLVIGEEGAVLSFTNEPSNINGT